MGNSQNPEPFTVGTVATTGSNFVDVSIVAPHRVWTNNTRVRTVTHIKPRGIGGMTAGRGINKAVNEGRGSTKEFETASQRAKAAGAPRRLGPDAADGSSDASAAAAVRGGGARRVC